MVKAVIFDMFETLVTQYYNCPLYFGEQIAADIGISNEEFQTIWHPSGEKRTIGIQTLEDVLEEILRKHNLYSEDLLRRIVEKRIATKRVCFENLNPEIIPMLEAIRRSNRKIALISNCFSEEVVVIRQSKLAGDFDSMLLSFEQGMKKPDAAIFEKCVKELDVTPKECLYIGDGGSSELEAARDAGMTAVQAGWYIEQSGWLENGRKPDFPLLHTPKDVLRYLGE